MGLYQKWHQQKIPSGKPTKNYGKSPFRVDFPMKNGGSFHSYVSLPEGKCFTKTHVISLILPSNLARDPRVSRSKSWRHGPLGEFCYPLNLTGFLIPNGLVVWNMNLIFPYIGNVIIPTDFHIFPRGGSTTNQIMSSYISN